MATGEGGDEQKLDGSVLAEDDLRDLALRALTEVREALVRLFPDDCHGPSPSPDMSQSGRLYPARRGANPSPSLSLSGRWQDVNPGGAPGLRLR